MLRKLFAVCLGIAFILGYCSFSNADMIIYRLEQVGGIADITLGSTAQFRVVIHTDTGSISNIDGLDFSVGVDDDGSFVDSGSRTTGGQIVAASAPQGGGFPIPPPTSFLTFTVTNFSQTLTTSDLILANFTVDTAGATPGTYEMSLHNLFAIDTGLGIIPIDFGNVDGILFYKIVPAAVPEPSLIAALALAVPAVPSIVRRRFRLAARR